MAHDVRPSTDGDDHPVDHSRWKDPETIGRASLGSIAVLIILAGQLAFFIYPDNWTWGASLTVLGIALFFWARFGTRFAWTTRLIGGVPLSISALLVFTAALFSLLAAWVDVALEHTTRTNFTPVIALWMSAGIALLAAFAHGRSLFSGWRDWLKRHQREILLLAIVSVLGAAVRFYKLGEIPAVINGDEGLIGQAALSTADKPLANPFAVWESMGGLFLQGIALGMSVFGRDPLGVRLLAAVSGTLAIPSIYILGRRLFGRRVALLAAIFLAFSHSHIHFSRTIAVSYTQGTLIEPLMLYFLISGLQEKSSLRMVVAAILLSIHFGIYIDSVIFIAYSAAFIFVAWLISRPLIRGRWRQILVFAMSIVIMMIPQIYYAVTHWPVFMSRFNADGVVQSGWLAATMELTGKSAATLLLERIGHAFLSLGFYAAWDFYGATIPLLSVITGALFIVGLVYSLYRTREPRYLLVNGYLIAPAVAIGLTAIPPEADSYRMLIALPPAILLAAVGLEEFLGITSLANSVARSARSVIIGLIIVSMATLNLKSYFVDFASKCRYGGDDVTRFASYLGNYLRGVDRSASTYLLSDDYFMYGTHGSVDFLSGGIPVTNVPDDADELESSPNMVVIAVPTRVDELRTWAKHNPGGKLDLQYDCSTLMLAAYRLP
jgi:4-amino-4-deoxy-L-arabinose transferase-like glycosyltransferase